MKGFAVDIVGTSAMALDRALSLLEAIAGRVEAIASVSLVSKTSRSQIISA